MAVRRVLLIEGSERDRDKARQGQRCYVGGLGMFSTICYDGDPSDRSVGFRHGDGAEKENLLAYLQF